MGRGDDRHWLSWVLSSAVAMASLLWVGLSGYVREFRLDLEDFPLVYHSSPPFVSLRDWTVWFSSGYSEYFNNYPEWYGGGYALARPLMNAALYVQGLAHPLLGDPSYLFLNYLAVIISVPLLMVLLHRLTGLSPAAATVLSVSLGLSPVWHQALFWPSLGTNAIALCLSIAAIAVLFPASQAPPSRSRIVISSLLQVLAVAGHETAIVTPVICALLLMWRQEGRPPIKTLWPLLAPLAYLAVSRVILPPAESVYAFEIDRSAFALRAARLAIGPFIPFEAMHMLLWNPATTLTRTVALTLAVASNLVMYGVLLGALLFARTRRLGLTLIALGVALVVAVPTNTEPRFMGLSLVLAVLAVLVGTENTPRLRTGLVILLVATNVAQFAYGMTDLGGAQLERVRDSGVAFDHLRESIAEHEPGVVVLVNDRTGHYGARAMLQMAAWPRQDTELIVLNSYGGPPAEGASTSVDAEGDVLRIRVVFGQDQHVRFDGAVPDFSVPTNGFRYRSIEGASADDGSFEAVTTLDDRTVLVVGTDLGTGAPAQPLVFTR